MSKSKRFKFFSFFPIYYPFDIKSSSHHRFGGRKKRKASLRKAHLYPSDERVIRIIRLCFSTPSNCKLLIAFFDWTNLHEPKYSHKLHKSEQNIILTYRYQFIVLKSYHVASLLPFQRSTVSTDSIISSFFLSFLEKGRRVENVTPKLYVYGAEFYFKNDFN